MPIASKELVALLAVWSVACSKAPPAVSAPADGSPATAPPASVAAAVPSATSPSAATASVPSPPTPAAPEGPSAPAIASALALLPEAPPAPQPVPDSTATPADSAGPRAVPSEPSRYGRFELTVAANGHCQVSFRRTSRGAVSALEVPDCIGDMLGVDKVAAAPRVGALALPAVSPQGDEFHLFTIATARGGNAVPGSESWVVVVRNNDLWATTELLAEGELKEATLPPGAPASLVLEEPATTTQPGARYTVTFGHLTKVDLPKLPSWIVGKKTQVIAGELEGGYRATGFLPSVSADGSVIVIDESGSCTFPATGEAAEGQVRMTAEVSTWSDGRTTVKCISIAR